MQAVGWTKVPVLSGSQFAGLCSTLNWRDGPEFRLGESRRGGEEGRERQ